MAGLTALDGKARQAVVRVLAPAEPIIFVTAPNPAAASRAAWPTAAAGALLTLLTAPIALVTVREALQALAWNQGALVPLGLAAIAVPALGMGLYLLLAPFAAARRARDTVILVTDRRLVTLSVRAGVRGEVPAEAILGVERRAVERGFGTLEIRHRQIGDHAETIFAGVDDVLEAETAIRRLTSETAG